MWEWLPIFLPEVVGLLALLGYIYVLISALGRLASHHLIGPPENEK